MHLKIPSVKWLTFRAGGDEPINICKQMGGLPTVATDAWCSVSTVLSDYALQPISLIAKYYIGNEEHKKMK